MKVIGGDETGEKIYHSLLIKLLDAWRYTVGGKVTQGWGEREIVEGIDMEV